MTGTPPYCSRCRAPLGRNVGGGVCTACLLEEALPAADGFAEPAADHGLDADTALVQHFGPYELLEEIGRGGMGVIYKARQPGLDRVVALKMLLAGEFADAKARERLLREAKIAARLTHPHIVTIHEVGEHDGRPYFAMEYVPGRNLAQHCRDGLLPVNTAVRYVEQLARAVHYAHQHGVIHRDLKPANILISPDDEPKLTDFGLTKSLVDPTRTIESAGSPNFMAPEQADSTFGTTGTPTDVFGLGAILYYLLTGRPPAVGETLTETLRAVVAGEPVPLRQLRPALPRDLETITLKCLEKEPARRYGSAQEVADELARWQRHEPIFARPATGAERFAKWVRRHPAVTALSAACSLAVILGFAGVTSQWQRAEVEAAAATKATLAARQAELTARRNAYAAELILASRAAGENRWQDVRTILDRTRPGPDQADLRSWEWRYLWQASRLATDGRFAPSTNKIWSMAALEDGRTVACGEKEGGFSLWDASGGRELYRLPEPINRMRHPTLLGGAPIVCRVATVPGTGLLAYTDCRSPTNGFIHLWHVARREAVRSLPLPGMPRHLAASPDGSRVACSLQWPDRRTLVFAVADGALVASLETEFSTYSVCHTLAFSADGQCLSLEDARAKCMRVVEIATGRDRHRFPLGQDFPLTAAFSPDGRWLVTGAGFDAKLPQLLVWDLERGERRAELPASSEFAVNFSADGRRLVTGLSIWRVPEFTLEREFDGLDANFKAALLLADGDALLTEDGRGGVLRWRLGSAPPTRQGHPLGRDVACCTFLPRGEGVLLVRTNGLAERAAAPDFRPVPVPALGTDMAAVCGIPEFGQIAVVRRNGSLSLHSAETFAESGRFDGTARTPTGYFCWVARAGALVLRTADEHLVVWDFQSQQRVWETALLPVRELTLSIPDGVLWQVHADGWLAGYDVVRKKILRQPLDHAGMHRIAVSGDGKTLLLTAPDGDKRLVDVGTGRTLSRLENFDLPAPHGGAFWPGGDRLGFNGLRVVDPVTSRGLLELAPDFAFPSTIFISGNGNLVLVTGGSRHAYLWRAPPWEEIRRAEPAEAAAGW
jgi:WD40 repeat protein/tRNA A-37 threonylcarbamoyl transferase component Bud32